MKILLAGATGYAGRRLKIRLLEEKDVSLRLLVLDARQVRESTRRRVEIVEGDIHDRETAQKALEGVDVVYYPIRFFGAVWEPEEFDGAAVERFRDICIEAGVKRLVYVGLHVAEDDPIKLLRNVVDTGMILSACPEKLQTVWLRVGAPLGSGSVMFELLGNVVQKIPAIISSRWMDTKINAVGVDDIMEYLVQVKDLAVRENLIIDIGSEQMSFKEMLKATARIMEVRRVFIPFPFTAHRLSSFLLTLVTPLSFRLTSPLIRALQSGELKAVRTDETARHYFPDIIPLAFDETMEKAIHEIENDQVMSRWVDTLESISYTSSEEDVEQAVYRDVKRMSFGDIAPTKIFRAVKSIGGREGWFTFDFLWRIRGFLDKLAGGYGTAMGKRAGSDLRVGDMLDVWKVVDIREGSRLLLEAQMKVFGKAWLEFRIEGRTLIQIAHHCPKGILGRLYWHCMLPFHFVIFRDMIRSIIKHAREME
jgi:uncharacterized protein YbjT (DUF2867 family)